MGDIGQKRPSTHMSNTSIAARILYVTDRYVTGDAPASAIAESLELHEPALEGVSREVRDKMQALAVAVIHEDVSPLEAAQLGFVHSYEALNDLQRILRSL